ncbi:hypothetical protein HMPREF9120_01514, partial [Neisseria sp. oral taxon 020 str. F0370]
KRIRRFQTAFAVFPPFIDTINFSYQKINCADTQSQIKSPP